MYKIFIYLFGTFIEYIYKVYKKFKINSLYQKLRFIGLNSEIYYPFNIAGPENISIKENVIIGAGSIIFASRAKLEINNNVIFGPNVTIITGDHMSIPGRYISTVKDEEKSKEYDKEVFIDSDVWIGANVTILKGVKIGRCSIIASGSVVISDLLPYSIVGGVPAKFIKFKFNKEEILKHEMILFSKRNDFISEQSDFYVKNLI